MKRDVHTRHCNGFLLTTVIPPKILDRGTINKFLTPISESCRIERQKAAFVKMVSLCVCAKIGAIQYALQTAWPESFHSHWRSNLRRARSVRMLRKDGRKMSSG